MGSSFYDSSMKDKIIANSETTESVMSQVKELESRYAELSKELSALKSSKFVMFYNFLNEH